MHGKLADCRSRYDRAPWLARLTYAYLWPLSARVNERRAHLQGADFDHFAPCDCLGLAASRRLEAHWRPCGGGRASLMRAIGRRFARQFALMLALLLVADCLCEPAYFYLSVRLIETIGRFPSASNASALDEPKLPPATRETLEGSLYASALLFLAAICGAQLLAHPYSWMAHKLSLELRAALATLVYGRALDLEPSQAGPDATNSAGPKQALGLISRDLEQLETSLIQLAWPLSATLQCLVLTLTLVQRLDLATALVALAINGAIALQRGHMNLATRRASREASRRAERRLAATGETLDAIRIIRLHAWTRPFERWLHELRCAELEQRNQLLMVQCVDAALFFVLCSGAALLTILFAHLARGLSLDQALVSQVFLASALYRRAMSRYIPQGLLAWLNFALVLERCESYLRAPPPAANNSNAAAAAAAAAAAPPASASFKAHNQTEPLQNGHATRATTPTLSGQPLLRLTQVSFAWPAAPPSFANLNLVAQPGELVLVSGRVACGKSTLLQLILGELGASAGEIQLSSGGGSSSSSQFKVAYAPQRPWIFAGSVRENVLLGEPLQLERYYEVLRVSCLLADLRRLAHFDRTLIGERGATLSEGQRARISLARALYQRAHLYLLDDPLAAVDALVARHIFQEALLGFLRAGGGGGGGGCDGVAAPPTVILVTHQVQYLRQADKLLLMLPSGAHFGTFQELELAGALAGLQLATPPEAEAEAHTLLQPEESQEGAPPASGGELERDQTIKRLLLTSPPRSRQDRGQPNESSLSEFECAQQHDELAGLRDERRQLAGAARALAFYLNQAGSRTEWLLFAAANVACRLLFMGLNIWLNYWAGLQGERAAANDAAAVAAADSFAASRLSLWGALEVALAMWLLLVGAAALRSRQFYALSSRAARLIHARLIQSLLRTNMSFHERTPRGQLINRLSADISHMDTAFVVLLNDLSLSGLSVAFIFASIIASSPSTALAIALIIALDVAIFKHFHKLMGALKRLEGCRRASLYSHVATTLEGLPIVRSANKRHLFLGRFLHLLDQNSSVRFLSLSLRRFIIGSLDSVLILFYVSLIGLDVRDTLQGQARFAFVGLNLIVQLARICQLTFTRLIEFYTTIPSMERLSDFCDLSSERAELLLEHQLSAAANNRLAELRQLLAPEPVEVEAEAQAEAQAEVDERAAGRQLLARAEGKLAHMERAMKRANFTRGRLEFAGVSLKFANTQEPALKQLSFRLEPGEKVGVVGRTGAGKSSLITALFRLHHFEGFILIDGQNTKELSPDSLRNSISIIPQEPTLFSGTLRHNLDPLGEHPDAELWRALQVVQLDGLLGSGGGSGSGGDEGKSGTNSESDRRASALQRPVGESGANFSIGQRQLICLARALLRRNKLLVLDEATANVDQLTDLQVQAAIRSEFAHCTVLTVAHRLDTVLDSDRIMVMQAGRLCEFGRPRELLERGRLLNEMIESTGRQQAAILRARILATSSSSKHNESSAAADDDENSPTYM